MNQLPRNKCLICDFARCNQSHRCDNLMCERHTENTSDQCYRLVMSGGFKSSDCGFVKKEQS